ncbi:MAG: peptidoglycan-binding protein, partial [Actinomycetota bacterium]|nr:peptidoglycan-binding protein [Actinomycetota bacterium]
PAPSSRSTATARGGPTEVPALPRRQRAEASVETLEAPAAMSLRSKATRVGTRRATTTKRSGAGPKRRRGGVRALQAALGLSPDGDFGPSTETALRRWQRERGLPVDGVAGPQTLAALKLGSGKVLKRERPARRRHKRSRAAKPRTRFAGARTRRARRGGGVRALQSALGLSADGVFGAATEKALRRYQKSKGLPVDGVAGPATRRALRLGPGKTLKRNRPHRRRSRGGGGGGGGGSSTVARVLAAANRIATKPYRYGGGHGSFDDSAYDCSGSVSYALHGGGLLSAPMASGAFMSYGAPGPGKHITIYATSGHMYMTINGRRFDTSARRQSGSRWGGPRRAGGGYVVRHPPGL